MTAAIAVSVVAWLPSVSAARAVRAHAAATNCSLAGKYRTLGATYVEKLSVSGTNCATGVSLVRQYNACRKKRGVAGRCTRKIMGYRFTEKRQSSPIAFTASVTAKNGRKVVKFSYTQNTH